MKKTLFTLVLAVCTFFVVNTVQAQNPHFTDVVINGNKVTGKVAGLGNKSGSVEVVFVSAVTVTQDCANHKNGNIVEEHSQTITISGGEGVYYTPGRNGSVNFSITLDLDAVAGVFEDCPGKMVEVLGDETTLRSLTFTTASGRTGSFTFE